VSVKTDFSIKDLENLSGVKAHTIRIWEKRYDLLEPQRTDTNIRSYDGYNLQRLLNVAMLVERGHKISKLSKLEDEQLFATVREEVLNKGNHRFYLNEFKMSMLNFDQELFDSTYNKLLADFSFREIFKKIFVDLLEEIGVLWMTDTITPVHEHFISTLIQQKILINIERVQGNVSQKDKAFVLFLPLNEIHELGLLYMHFELLLKGYRSVYLGASVPVDNLVELRNMFSNIVYVSYFTIYPEKEKVEDYVNHIGEEILEKSNEQLWVLGRNTRDLDSQLLHKSVKIFEKIDDVVALV